MIGLYLIATIPPISFAIFITTTTHTPPRKVNVLITPTIFSAQSICKPSSGQQHSPAPAHTSEYEITILEDDKVGNKLGRWLPNDLSTSLVLLSIDIWRVLA